MFAPAVKTESKLRMAIAGPSGSGKTYTALAVAAELVPDGKVAVIDTEHGSAAKYADLFKFDVAHAAPPYHPDGLIKLVTYAANNGYDVIIVDSTTHYWSGAGGVLDLKDDAERRMRNPNSYTAWKDVTPIHQRMVDALISVPAHVIVTMRSKQEYVLVEKNGKQVPQKMGMAPIQRDGFEYEFDVMMDMDVKNVGHVTKTRCPALTDRDFVKPGADMAAILREWLTGAAPSQAPAPVVFAPAPPAVNGKAQPAADSGPLPDDELTIEEAPAAQFIPDGCRPAGNGRGDTQGAAQVTRLWQYPRQARRTRSGLSQATRRPGRGR
jgi:DNA polymerase III delta prime subunit